jgi:hypothetical protein
MSAPARFVRALVPLLALALSACEGASGPEGMDGRYGVYRVNGQPTPAPVSSNPAARTMQVVDAHLELDAPNATIELEMRLVGENGAVGSATTFTYIGTYQVSGGAITFSQLQSNPPGLGATAQGVVNSSREVAVTLELGFPTYQGYFTYPMSLVLRR